MKRYSSILLLIFGLALLGGCKTTTNNIETPPPANNNPVITQADSPTDYYPVTVGSSWEYEGSGNEYATFTRKVLFTKGNLAQTSEDNGGTVATRIIDSNASAVKIVYFEGESYNPSNLLETNFTANANSVLLMAPIQVGTTWTEDTNTKTIMAIDAVVDTPAGQFDNCVKVKIANPNDTSYEYYKKGVGMVKREFISGDTTVTSTLQNYKIK